MIHQTFVNVLYLFLFLPVWVPILALFEKALAKRNIIQEYIIWMVRNGTESRGVCALCVRARARARAGGDRVCRVCVSVVWCGFGNSLPILPAHVVGLFPARTHE